MLYQGAEHVNFDSKNHILCTPNGELLIKTLMKLWTNFFFLSGPLNFLVKTLLSTKILKVYMVFSRI